MQRGFLKLQKTRLGLPKVVVICCLMSSHPDKRLQPAIDFLRLS